MKDFDFVRATDAADASRRGAEAGARFIAGGTLLVDLMRLEVERPDVLIDLSKMPWKAVEQDGNGVRVGALVKNSELAHHPLITKEFPGLSQALLSGASPQIRNMATTGGNLLQRPRCPYFRDVQEPSCNKRKPGSGCAAREGFSRMHAILGTSEQCIAVNPSDMNVALAALDATVIVTGRRGERTIPILDFHVEPGDHPERETQLAHDEVVTHVHLPMSAAARRSVYVKVRDRASFAFALVSAAAGLELEGKTIRAARVAIGGATTKPWRCHETEQRLIGKPASSAAFQEAAALAVNGAKTTPHNAFKIELVKRTIARALEESAGITT